MLRDNAIKHYLNYHSGHRSQLAREIYAFGLNAAREGREQLAVAVDFGLSAQAGKYYTDLANRADEVTAAGYIVKAMNFTVPASKAKAYTDRLLTVGQKYAKTPGKELQTSAIREALIVLNGKEWVDDTNHLPEVVVYQPGEYIVELKAGEQTAHWIKISSSVKRYDFDSGQGGDRFIIIRQNDEQIKAWTVKSLPANMYIFKLMAVENQEKNKAIKMSFQ